VPLLFGGVKKFGYGYPSVCKIIEAVTDRTVEAFNNYGESAYRLPPVLAT
jgi:hypothetical protein